MSMQEPNFFYNPQTGVYVPPPAMTHNLPAMQTYAVPPSTGHAGTGYPQPSGRRAPQRSRKDRMTKSIYGLIKEHYYKGITARGAALLVKRNTLEAIPLEANELVHDVQSLALQTAGIAVTPSDVEQAMGAINGDQPDVVNLRATISLAINSEQGEIFLNTSSGIVAIQPSGGYYHPPQLPNQIAFLRLRNGQPPCFQAYDGQVSIQPLLSLLGQLNVPKESQLLVLTWLVNSLHPKVDNVLLEIVGGRYTGASTLQHVLKMLIDPSLMSLMDETPKTASQAYQLGKHDHVISLDNVLELKPEVQAALLALLKGKITDIRSSKKERSTPTFLAHPIVLNSSESVVTLSGLADRSVLVPLPELHSITEHHIQRLSEKKMFQPAFASLVALLDAAHSRWRSISPGKCPAGMVDFYRIGIAVAEAIGSTADDFDQQLQDSMKRRFEWELYEYPVAVAIRDMLGAAGEDSLDLPMGELLDRLNEHRPDHVEASEWPRSPRHLGAKLDECGALLAAYGMHVSPPIRKGKRGVYHRRIEKCVPQIYRPCDTSFRGLV